MRTRQPRGAEDRLGSAPERSEALGLRTGRRFRRASTPSRLPPARLSPAQGGSTRLGTRRDLRARRRCLHREVQGGAREAVPSVEVWRAWASAGAARHATRTRPVRMAWRLHADALRAADPSQRCPRV